MFGKTRKKNDDTDDLIISDLGVNKDVVTTRASRKKVPFEAKFDFKKVNVKTFALSVLAFLVLITFTFIFRFVNFNATILLWKTNIAKSSESINNKSIEYASFKNGLMRISNDGMTYINENGEVKWTVSYNMKDPIYEKNGNYFAIADRNGNNFYIFNKDGKLGENTTTNSIVKISVSEEGVLYILQSDENSSYVNVFRNTGVPIDITIKTNLTEDGMPIDLSTSNNGEELVVASVCLNDNNVYTKATYYNFADAGKNANQKRIVAEFKDELNDKFLARVKFFDNTRSCLIYDGGIYYVSTTDESNPSISNNLRFDDKMKSISYNDKYMAVVFENNKLMSFDTNGNTLCSREITYDYDEFYIDDDYMVFLYGNRVMIYDIRGRMIFDKEVDSNIQYVAKKKSLFFTELLLGLVDGVECLRFY